MERPTQGHKRSKSSLALSLLHRDKLKNEDRDDDSSSAAAESPTASPTASHHGFSSLRLHRSRQQAPEFVPDDQTTPKATDERMGITMTHPEEVQTTVEQSVKMFRLFEVLRSGDTAAVRNAVLETSSKSASTKSPPSGPAAATTGLVGTTILHLAVQCASQPVVEQILHMASSESDVEIDINAQDQQGNTPLHLASKLGRVNVVRSLLQLPDIDFAAYNYQGRTPTDLARSPEIFQQLQLARALYVESKIKKVHELVVKADYDALENLFEDPRVEATLDVNSGELATDPETLETGGTLLHEAARKKDLRLAQLMLLHGADPFYRDKKGRLPQDVTKDERTRSILKKSPAATAAQRGIQEKAILGNPLSDKPLGGKESREIKGYLKKWTNYTTGYKLRWFVLEDGVLSYYKHQDDAGSACRGAINMRIAKLIMDAQDKTRFEIHGKSSVKYHLKANHVVEAKRWFWALNNAIQWTKDEEKEIEQKKNRDLEVSRQAKLEQEGPKGNSEVGDRKSTRFSGKGLTPATALEGKSSNASFASLSGSAPGLGDSMEFKDSSYVIYEPSNATNEMDRVPTVAGDVDDDEEYGDDASDRELHPTPKDAFNITAHSANLQLELLAQVSSALQTEISTKPETPISDPTIAQAVTTYEGAVRSLQSMVGDLLKIARDREAYWQYRVDREVDMRHLWEDSMAKVAKEQQELEGRIGESEEKRKRTKRALREALDAAPTPPALVESSTIGSKTDQMHESMGNVRFDPATSALGRQKSIAVSSKRRQSSVAAWTGIPDSDEEDDEEFFDAVDAGEVKVLDTMPTSPSSAQYPGIIETSKEAEEDTMALELRSSFKGYEDPPRAKLKMDADDRPKISLWGILKSMIGKDMTKMTLPVSFNEPTSLLQRVAEDMEYTDLLDFAADRMDSSERMVYVAAFAASEYASTIGRVAKPFNPLLAETYEYVRPDKGYRFFIEQVSHHPPIGAAWAESAKWTYYGESAVKSKFYGKSFDINPLGTWFLKLKTPQGSEELYTWKKVTSSVIGIITGSPAVDNYGPMEVKNWTTGEVCMLDFKARGWRISSAYQVIGKVVTSDGRTNWSVGGRWNDKIYARLGASSDDAALTSPTDAVSQHEANSSQAFLVWEAHSRPAGIPFNLTPFVVTLNAVPDSLRPILPPTDTRLRPDQRAMEDGLYDFAATEKNRVEEKQRAKRREREARGEEFVPRWFSKGRCEVTGEEYWVFSGEYWKMRDEVARGVGKWKGVEDIF